MWLGNPLLGLKLIPRKRKIRIEQKLLVCEGMQEVRMMDFFTK
jgi:hypothetical protein